MGSHINSRSRSIRLSNELWDIIEAEAEANGMSPNELLRRRLTTSFFGVSGHRKTVNNAHEAEMVTVDG